MFGILNIHKPSGITSRRAVDVIQRLVRPAKAGHAGTLDPLASGVLVMCVGPATRLIEYVQRMPKSYRGTFMLGQESNTEDVEGEVVALADPPIPTRDDLERAARALTGPIQQRPPAFSALKVAGRRAYDLARAGEQVDLAPRPITIHALTVVAYEYPTVTLEVECSSGTYIRSLGRDLAESLGTGAVMSDLVRTAIGPYTLADAIDPGTLTAANLPSALRSPLEALTELPCVQLDEQQARLIRNGIAIPMPNDSNEIVASPHVAADYAGEYKAIDASGRLVALLARRASRELGPVRNFPTG